MHLAMNTVAVINFFLIAGVIQGFVFNMVTLLSGKKISKVLIYLNLTVLFISLNNLQAWISDKGFATYFFYIKQLLVPWYLFILPVFYSFLRYFLRIQNEIKGYVKIAVVLFAIELFIRLMVISYVYFFVEGRNTAIIDFYTDVEDVMNLIFSLFVFYKACILVFKKQNTFEVMLSYDDISWIKFFLKIGSLVMLFWVFAKLADIIMGIKTGYVFLRLGTSILLYWIGYQGLYRYNLVMDRIGVRRSLAARNTSFAMQLPIIEPNNKHIEEYQKINSYIIEKQRFLDPNLSMYFLAEELHISTSHLSKLINNYSGYNFSDYINALRVEQAKELLIDSNFDHYTIIAIGLECGFNSKSTFYAAFKKFTSLTPKEYQERLQLK